MGSVWDLSLSFFLILATSVVYVSSWIRGHGPGIESKLSYNLKLQLQQWQILRPIAPGQGSNPCPCSDLSLCSQIRNPLHHNRNFWDLISQGQKLRGGVDAGSPWLRCKIGENQLTQRKIQMISSNKEMKPKDLKICLIGWMFEKVYRSDKLWNHFSFSKMITSNVNEGSGSFLENHSVS